MYHPEPAALERHHGTASASTPDHDSPLHLDRSPPNLLEATSSPALGPVAPYPTDKQVAGRHSGINPFFACHAYICLGLTESRVTFAGGPDRM